MNYPEYQYMKYILKKKIRISFFLHFLFLFLFFLCSVSPSLFLPLRQLCGGGSGGNGDSGDVL